MAIIKLGRKLEPFTKELFRRCVSTVSTNSMHICIVGSGPAGFYTAEKVLKRFSKAKVDILDRLPTPFGLVRSGVAPDHPETKFVITSLHGWPTLIVAVILETYAWVVLAYGAESDRQLGIPGEELVGVHSAREFVWWYDGHPDCANLPVNLKGTDTAAVVGQGNVALDVACILLRPVAELGTTDISEYALAVLWDSHIR